MSAAGEFTGDAGEAVPRGFRWWRVAPSGEIYSAWFDIAWSPASNEATCALPVTRLGRRAWARRHVGGVPATECSCGFYALHEMPTQAGVQPDPDRPWLLDPDDWSGRGASVVFGVAEAWGRVLIGTQGWRARFSRALALYVPNGSELWESDRLRLVNERYGIPVTNTLDALAEWAPEQIVVIPEAEPEPERLPQPLNLLTAAAIQKAGDGSAQVASEAAATEASAAPPAIGEPGRIGSSPVLGVPERWPSRSPGAAPFGTRPPSSAETAARTERQMAAIERLAGGPGPKRILELGAEAGRRATPLADRGHSVIAVAGAFADMDLPGPFDVVYYGGFGAGSEDDQHQTLRDLARRAGPEGCVLIEVMTPWSFATAPDPRTAPRDGDRRAFAFDPDASRAHAPLSGVWSEGDSERSWLRCYAPADLRLLLRGTGLGLESYEAFAGAGYETAPRLDAATFYLARLTVGA